MKPEYLIPGILCTDPETGESWRYMGLDPFDHTTEVWFHMSQGRGMLTAAIFTQGEIPFPSLARARTIGPDMNDFATLYAIRKIRHLVDYPYECLGKCGARLVSPGTCLGCVTGFR